MSQANNLSVPVIGTCDGKHSRASWVGRGFGLGLGLEGCGLGLGLQTLALTPSLNNSCGVHKPYTLAVFRLVARVHVLLSCFYTG